MGGSFLGGSKRVRASGAALVLSELIPRAALWLLMEYATAVCGGGGGRGPSEHASCGSHCSTRRARSRPRRPRLQGQAAAAWMLGGGQWLLRHHPPALLYARRRHHCSAGDTCKVCGTGPRAKMPTAMGHLWSHRSCCLCRGVSPWSLGSRLLAPPGKQTQVLTSGTTWRWPAVAWLFSRAGLARGSAWGAGRNISTQPRLLSGSHAWHARSMPTCWDRPPWPRQCLRAQHACRMEGVTWLHAVLRGCGGCPNRSN